MNDMTTPPSRNWGDINPEFREVLTRDPNFAVPELPRFASAEQERTHIKQRLTGAFRLFSKFGFDEGVAGHITVRDPVLKDHFWVNPFGMHFSMIKTSDLSLVDHSGKVVQGRPINLAAFRIHGPIHAARPDCHAAAHAHSLYGKTWSALGRPLDPITQDACQFYRDHSVHHEFRGVVYESQEGENIATSLGDGKAVILRNHGLLTVGQTVDEAAWWFITMERCCQSQLLAEAAGKPILIDDANAARTQKQLGTHYAGWFAFQNLWQRIIKEQPDLVD
jgi:ribulose-5-phosphate 4-epimerase/fuculose-1-phosphate aldolase